MICVFNLLIKRRDEYYQLVVAAQLAINSLDSNTVFSVAAAAERSLFD